MSEQARETLEDLSFARFQLLPDTLSGNKLQENSLTNEHL